MAMWKDDKPRMHSESTIPSDRRDIGDFTPNMRHYHAPSEPFTSGDTLQTFLYRGWQPAPEVQRHVYWFSAMCSVSIYVFQMQYGDQLTPLPVQVNPFVVRFVQERRLRLVPGEDHESWPIGQDKP
jgi:hypothetical protein